MKWLYESVRDKNLAETPEAFFNRTIESFYKKLEADLMIGFFFAGKDLNHIASRQTAFLLRSMGAPYNGSIKPIADAHSAIPPILPGFFDRRILLLKQHLESAALGAEEVAVWIDFEKSFRENIIQNTGSTR
jgi:truncated hemoglobin YjbI